MHALIFYTNNHLHKERILGENKKQSQFYVSAIGRKVLMRWKPQYCYHQESMGNCI